VVSGAFSSWLAVARNSSFAVEDERRFGGFGEEGAAGDSELRPSRLGQGGGAAASDQVEEGDVALVQRRIARSTEREDAEGTRPFAQRHAEPGGCLERRVGIGDADAIVPEVGEEAWATAERDCADAAAAEAGR